jgi:hypothetical protein
MTAEQCGRRTLYARWPAIHSSHPYSTWQVRRGALQYEICDKEEQELHFPPLLRLLLLLHLPLIPLLLSPFLLFALHLLHLPPSLLRHCHLLKLAHHSSSIPCPHTSTLPATRTLLASSTAIPLQALPLALLQNLPAAASAATPAATPAAPPVQALLLLLRPLLLQPLLLQPFPLQV